MGKKVTLKINGQDIHFDIELLDFHSLLDELETKNKVQPSHDFVMRTVVPDDKDSLTALINDNPGLEVELMGLLMSEYKTKVAISVKKPNSTSEKSKLTQSAS